MDKQLRVSTLYDCQDLDGGDFQTYKHDPAWCHNMIGCRLIRFIQLMYGLNITYSIGPLSRSANTTIDIYASPQIINPDIMAIADPVQTIVLWRFGFILRRPYDMKLFNRYYTKPFTKAVWDGLFAIGGFVWVLFFFLSWWEKRIEGGTGECNIGLEMLLIIGGYCQHIFPVETILCSRRTAHFTFFLFSYIIYTVYTSNLLSNLVNDKETDIKLTDVLNSDYDLVTFSYMKNLLSYEYASHNFSYYKNSFKRLKIMDIDNALVAVMTNKIAFLSDYTSIYPSINRKLENSQICDLIEIDLTTNVRKYIFASKHFRYMEEFKIGTIRAQEAGILKRKTPYEYDQPLNCNSMHHQEVKFIHIVTPLVVILATFVLSFVILVIERIHYKRNKVWPYVN